MSWRATAILAALALSLLRTTLDSRSHSVLLAQARLHPESLAADPLVRAAEGAPYTQGPRRLAPVLAWLSHKGLPLETASAGLVLALWVLQAGLMFRLARRATGRDDAAFLACCLFGLEMPLFPSAVPNGMTGLDRSLGLVPLLWGLGCLFSGDRWLAWAGLGAATYMHANPAIHLWPLFAASEAWSAFKDPASRRGALSRLAAAAVMGAPLLLSAGGDPFSEGAAEAARVSLIAFGPYIGGFGMTPTDYLFCIEGLLLLAAAAYGARELPGRELVLRAAALSLLMLAAGTLTYAFYVPGHRLLGAVVKLQPWVSLYVLELCGLLLFSFWLTQEAERDEPLWLALLFTLSQSWQHDWVLRLLSLALAACVLAKARRLGTALALGFAVLPLLNWAAPAALRGAATLVHLRGGFLALPAFAPVTTALLLASLAAAAALARRVEGTRKPALAAAALLLLLVSWRQPHAQSDKDLMRMAAWVKQHTPETASLAFFPLHPPDCVWWMSHAARPVLACVDHIEGPMLYGERGREMGERLAWTGYDFSRVKRFSDLGAELDRLDRELTPEKALALYRAGRADYLLTRTARPWPKPPIHVEGPYALYALGGGS